MRLSARLATELSCFDLTSVARLSLDRAVRSRVGGERRVPALNRRSVASSWQRNHCGFPDGVFGTLPAGRDRHAANRTPATDRVAAVISSGSGANARCPSAGLATATSR